MGCPDAEHASGSGESKVHSLWYLGVILSIVGSVCSNMGVNMQKYSFMREAKRRVTHKRSYVLQPLWVIGLLLVIGGSVLDFVALGFLPQSLAAPVGGSTMIANVVFASLFLKEKFTRLDALGTALVLVGICIVASFADKESGCYTIDELVALYREPLFIMYAFLMGSAAIGIFLLSKRMEKVKARHGSSSHAYKRFRKLHPVSYPALSGICGAQSILFAKSVAELVKTTAEGDSQFGNVITYVFALAMFASVFLQIHWLAHGLQHFDAVFIVPVFQCFFISVSIFGGGVYFKEFARMDALSLAMFFFGAGITISGVYLLSHRDMHRLKPRGRFRAAVSTIIFLKRCQKARNIEYRWVQGNHLPVILGPGTSKVILDIKGSKPPSIQRLSKASVVPVTSGQSGGPPLPPPEALASKKDTPEAPPIENPRKLSASTTITTTNLSGSYHEDGDMEDDRR